LATQRGQKSREDGLEQPIWAMFEERLQTRLAAAPADKDSKETGTRSMVRRLDL
jgi:hypothetical protein